jgi:hypothetical protein
MTPEEDYADRKPWRKMGAFGPWLLVVLGLVVLLVIWGVGMMVK